MTCFLIGILHLCSNVQFDNNQFRLPQQQHEYYIRQLEYSAKYFNTFSTEQIAALRNKWGSDKYSTELAFGDKGEHYPTSISVEANPTFAKGRYPGDISEIDNPDREDPFAAIKRHITRLVEYHTLTVQEADDIISGRISAIDLLKQKEDASENLMTGKMWKGERIRLRKEMDENLRLTTEAQRNIAAGAIKQLQHNPNQIKVDQTDLSKKLGISQQGISKGLKRLRKKIPKDNLDRTLPLEDRIIQSNWRAKGKKIENPTNPEKPFRDWNVKRQKANARQQEQWLKEGFYRG